MLNEKNEVNSFSDMWPEDHKYYTFLKKVFRHEFRKNWFKRISTPIIEKKETYIDSLLDKISDFSSICSWNSILRTIPSIPIMRAYIEWTFEQDIQPVYFYYVDRYFSIKNNILSESFLIWGEIIWENDPILEALLIHLTYTVLCEIGLQDSFKLKINILWSEKEKTKYLDELKSFYENKKHLLSEESLIKLDKNPILLLNSKHEDELILAESAPKIVKFLKKDSKAHFLKIKEYLDLLSVPYTEDNKVIDDYSFNDWAIWEFSNEKYGVFSTWTRHNSLSIKLWKTKEVPATWFFLDVNIVISMLKDGDIKIVNKDKIDLYFVQLWDEAKKVVFPLSFKARLAGINTMVSLWTPSIKEQILKWTRLWAKFLVIVWVMEARNWNFQVRNMIDWTQAEVNKEELIDYIIEKIWIKNLDFYSPTKDLIISE